MVARFIERFSGVLVDGGVPRMPARVFALLLASDDGRLTAAELADELQVSPAAVSGAVRYLLQTGLIERARGPGSPAERRASPAGVPGAARSLPQPGLIDRARGPGSRRDVYRLGDDPWYEAIYRREPLLMRWERALSDGVEAVGPDTSAGRRL